jgi:hypothetical protein
VHHVIESKHRSDKRSWQKYSAPYYQKTLDQQYTPKLSLKERPTPKNNLMAMVPEPKIETNIFRLKK